jgi:hypothetical protein
VDGHLSSQTDGVAPLRRFYVDNWGFACADGVHQRELLLMLSTLRVDALFVRRKLARPSNGDAIQRAYSEEP